MSSLESSTLTTMPPEILLSIFDFLPSRTLRTTVSPVETNIRHVLPKRTVENISLTCSRLRQVMLPSMFESVVVKNSARFSGFVAAGGDLENIGRYAKSLTMRWETAGEIVPLSEQNYSSSRRENMRKGFIKILNSARGLQNLVLDFPGAFDALEFALNSDSDGVYLQDLKMIKIRNGRFSYNGDVTQLLEKLAELPRLKHLSLNGNRSQILPNQPLTAINSNKLFPSLTTLELASISTLTDSLLRQIIWYSSSIITSLSIRSCPSLTLKASRQLLQASGPNFRHLDLEILKPCEDPETLVIEEDEHLCPVLRDRCINLEVLGLYTNRICKDIFFGGCEAYSKPGSADTSNSASTTTSGLPTPPGSATLLPVNTNPSSNLPTPPSDPIDINFPEDRISSPLLSSPLFPVPITTHRAPLKKVTLQLPYDASSLKMENMGGPSLQQVHTFLCNGEPAKELLTLGEKAFADGIVEDVLRVQGHWKGGPYLFLKD